MKLQNLVCVLSLVALMLSSCSSSSLAASSDDGAGGGLRALASSKKKQAAKDAECRALKGAVACGTDAGCVYLAPIKEGNKVKKSNACVAQPATCAAASFDKRACEADNAAGTVCRFQKGVCSEVRFCHQVSKRGQCERAGAHGIEGGCTWMTTMSGRGRNRRTVSRCASTPVTCSEAGKNAALCAIADMNCVMHQGVCTPVTSCEGATTKLACSKVGVVKMNQLAGVKSTECVWFPKRVVRNRVMAPASCEATPKTCGEASSRRLCGVVADNCDWGVANSEVSQDESVDTPFDSKGANGEYELEAPPTPAPTAPQDTCHRVDTCIGASTRALCDGVVSESCLWVPAERNDRGRVIQAAQCAEIPQTCEAAAMAETCSEVVGLNCEWVAGACANIETCEAAASKASCLSVSKVACEWKLPVRRSGRVIQDGSCTAQCKPNTYQRCAGQHVCNDKTTTGKHRCADAVTGCSDRGGIKFKHCSEV